MTKDITPSLRRAVSKGQHWSRDDVQRTVIEIAGEGSDRSLDWDEGAGEAWARVVDADGVVAMVYARLPLIVVREEASAEIDRLAWNAEMIDVTSVADEDLRADEARLIEAFPELAAHLHDGKPEFSPECFTAEELWFLTV